MMALRFAAILLTALSLGGLAFTPNGPATLWLTGLFFTFFGIVCFTCRETKPKETTMNCTFCDTKTDSPTISSDGKISACPDCYGSAEVEPS